MKNLTLRLLCLQRINKLCPRICFFKSLISENDLFSYFYLQSVHNWEFYVVHNGLHHLISQCRNASYKKNLHLTTISRRQQSASMFNLFFPIRKSYVFVVIRGVSFCDASSLIILLQTPSLFETHNANLTSNNPFHAQIILTKGKLRTNDQISTPGVLQY